MVRANIWDEFRRMQLEMDRLLNSLIGNDFYQPALPTTTSNLVPDNYRQPLTDIAETDNEFVATVELPGVEKKDIKINATESGIDIQVEKKDEKKQEDKGMYRLERRYAGFYRHIPLPDGVNLDGIKASYKNGVLELRIPKQESKKKGKTIKVE